MILTIRTDKPESEIGLFEGEKELAYESWQAHRQLAETIHQKIQDILHIHDKRFSDISGVIVFKGPGSFTGLRIGVSVANALANGLIIPIVGTDGQEWIQQGLELLARGEGTKVVLPEYGTSANITKPKK